MSKQYTSADFRRLTVAGDGPHPDDGGDRPVQVVAGSGGAREGRQSQWSVVSVEVGRNRPDRRDRRSVARDDHPLTLERALEELREALSRFGEPDLGCVHTR